MVLSQFVQHQRAGENGSDRIGNVFSRVLGGGTVDRFKHGNAVGIDVAAGAEAQTAADPGCEIGENVSEEIGSKHHPEIRGLFDQPHGSGIDVDLFGSNFGIIRRNGVKGILPDGIHLRHGITLGDAGDFCNPLPLCQIEGIACNTRRPAVRDQAEVVAVGIARRNGRTNIKVTVIETAGNRGLQLPVSGFGREGSTGTDIKALGVFPYDLNIKVFRALDRGFHTGPEPGRTEIDILIQLRPHGKQKLLLDDAGLDPRVSDRTEENRIMLPQLLKTVLRNDDAGLQIVGPAIGIIGIAQGETFNLCNSVQDLDAFPDNFRPDAVSRHAGDVIAFHGCASFFALR